MYPVDLFGVVRKLHITEGNSSAQAPAARRSGALSLGFRPCRIRPFVVLTCPLACGCATDAMSSQVFCSLQNSVSSPIEKLLSLSVIMLCG